MARTSISARARWCRSIRAARSACWAAATAVSPWTARCARPAHRGGYRRAGLRCARQPASRTHNRAIWIGGAATLDVAGRAAGGVDIDGRRYGRRRRAAASCWAARWTGTRPASPRAPVISPSWCAGRRAGRLGLAPGHRRATRQPPGDAGLAGDGGQIVLKSSYGLFLDGDMRARAGGAGAAGGTLALALETPTFPLSVNAEDGVRRPRELIYRRARRPAAGIGSQAGAARSGAASWRGAPVGAAVRGRRLRQPVAAGQRDSQFRRRRGPVGLAKPALLCRQLCRDRPRDGRHGRQPVRAASTAGRRGARRATASRRR